jgi:uncharacterized protein (DUF2235 family)
MLVSRPAVPVLNRSLILGPDRRDTPVKRLVICCDGTWNTPDHKEGGGFAPTNVVRLARAVVPLTGGGTHQVVFYDPGVGTDNLVDKVTGGAVGIGLTRNVLDAYLFLVHNFAEGDEIYFFGFSRGAYTVRSTAGFIRKLGLTRKEHAERIPEGLDIYREREGGPDSPRARQFRDAYSLYPVQVKFIGVWDTVGALGIPGFLNFLGRKRFEFHDVALSSRVLYAYQALAIDEKRKFFEPTLWEQSPEAANQKMEQAWFPGVHMDVGGGYKDASLASEALLWMAAKAEETGLDLEMEHLLANGSPDALGKLHESRNFPYTVIPAYQRPIGRGVPPWRAVKGGKANESLHASAEARYAKDASYRPPNLVEYLQSHASVDRPDPASG